MTDKMWSQKLTLSLRDRWAKTNTSDIEAPFLDLNLIIANDMISTKLYDKRDGLDFDILNFFSFWMAMPLMLHPMVYIFLS